MGWSGVKWGGVECSVQSLQLIEETKQIDTYAPKAIPSNPRKHMNDTLTRWGFAFSRARCRCGVNNFIGSRGSRGGKNGVDAEGLRGSHAVQKQK
jgi:hypothetical protein